MPRAINCAQRRPGQCVVHEHHTCGHLMQCPHVSALTAAQLLAADGLGKRRRLRCSAPRAPVPSSPLPRLGAILFSATTARAPAPSRWCVAPQRGGSVARSPASRALHLRSREHHGSRRPSRARSGRKARAAPSRWRPARRSAHEPRAARRAPSASDIEVSGSRRGLREHVARHSLGKGGEIGGSLAAPASLASAIWARKGAHLVRASARAARSLHLGKRRPHLSVGRQRDDLGEIGRRAARGKHLGTTDPAPTRTGARFGRRFPRRAPPPWNPHPWHPLSKRNPQWGGALWLRGRSERRGRRRPLRLGGTGAAPRAPVLRLRRPAACRSPCGWARLARGRHPISDDGALSVHRCCDAGLGVSAAPACALRRDGQHGQWLCLTRPASRRLQWRLASLTAAIVGPLRSASWGTRRPVGRLAAGSLVMGSPARLAGHDHPGGRRAPRTTSFL